MKIKALERYASEKIGDGKSPNLYFVSEQGMGVVLITRFFDVAYDYWNKLSRVKETSLEDRKFGVICSTEKAKNGPILHETTDLSEMFRKMFPDAP